MSEHLSFAITQMICPITSPIPSAARHPSPWSEGWSQKTTTGLSLWVITITLNPATQDLQWFIVLLRDTLTFSLQGHETEPTTSALLENVVFPWATVTDYIIKQRCPKCVPCGTPQYKLLILHLFLLLHILWTLKTMQTMTSYQYFQHRTT